MKYILLFTIAAFTALMWMMRTPEKYFQYPEKFMTKDGWMMEGVYVNPKITAYKATYKVNLYE